MHRTIATIAATALLAGAGTATADHLVSGQDVRNGSLTGADLRNGSVGPRDLSAAARRSAAASIPKARLASVVEDVITDPASGIRITVKGEAGPAGAQGPAGDRGPAGAPGIADVIVREATVDVAPSSSAGVTAKCSPGERVTGGGSRFTGGDGTGIAQDSYPLADSEQGWTAVYTNRSDSATGTAHAFAVCARVG